MSNKVEIINGLKFRDNNLGEGEIFTVENISESSEICDVTWMDNDKKYSITYTPSFIDECINITKVWAVVE